MDKMGSLRLAGDLCAAVDKKGAARVLLRLATEWCASPGKRGAWRFA